MAKDPQTILNEAKENNEPVFVIRAQDKIAIKAISAYMMLADQEGCSTAFIIDLSKRIVEFSNYKMTNSLQMKRPDL